MKNIKFTKIKTYLDREGIKYNTLVVDDQEYFEIDASDVTEEQMNQINKYDEL